MRNGLIFEGWCIASALICLWLHGANDSQQLLTFSIEIKEASTMQ